MNAYEITFIVRPDMDDDQTKAAAQQVTGRVESAGGEIIASYAWTPARRRMAYPIRDFGDGYYFTTTFRIDPQSLRELESALKLNENVLRFLIVQASDQAVRQSQQRAQQQAAAAASPPSAAPAPAARAAAPSAPAPAAVEETQAVPSEEAVAAEVESGDVSEAVEEVEEAPQPEPVSTAAAAGPSEAEE